MGKKDNERKRVRKRSFPIEQVWRCGVADHPPVEAPLGIKYTGAICGRCAAANPTKHNVREKASVWTMKLVKVRSRNGRMVDA